MSGPFGSSQWMYSSGGFYPYEIEQSLRFNDDDSAYLNRTPASAGNRKTFTYSFWVKRGNLGTDQVFLDVNSGSAGTPRSFFSINSADKLRVGFNPTGSAWYDIQTSQVFRDVSAWYHIMFSVDTTQVTASDRTKLYVNGQQVTAFSSASYVPQSTDLPFNAVYAHYIGRSANNINYLDGYMAEVNFIDGSALDPTSFGEFKSDIWIPKEYSGSYGTNGFYLPFSDSAAIGDDLSGNTNDWTANNLAATDVVLDSPTENYATWNPLDVGYTLDTLSEGNLKNNGNTASHAKGNFWVSSGKWYFEVNVITVVGGGSIGFTTKNYSVTSSGYYAYRNSGIAYPSGASYGASYGAGDIVGVALDMDAGEIFFYKNGAIQNSGTPAFTGIVDDVSPLIEGYGSGGLRAVANFGQDSSFAGNKTAQGNTDANGLGDFYYTPPSGYLALNTANLPDPVIDPAEDDVPADYFNTVLYTGNGSTQSITGVGFQPDWVWGKSRSTANSNTVMDAVRGVGEILFTNTTDAGTAEANNITSFDADGFSLGNSANFNGNLNSYVAWNWLAGNGTASNTDGTITSTVSVNQKAGFSVVGYTGTGANATVGHGLGAAPKVILAKDRDATQQWHCGFTEIGWDRHIHLDLSNAQSASGSAAWNSTAPTSSVFSLGASGGTNASGNDFIAYCFAEVEGFSKFGSYTGNGSTNGPFVYCGFRPAWVMFKRTNSTGNWIIFDAERGIYNLNDNYLYANSSNAEGTSSTQGVDLLSNGFKHRNTYNDANTSGGTYIFMAFAEQPVKYSLAR